MSKTINEASKYQNFDINPFNTTLLVVNSNNSQQSQTISHFDDLNNKNIYNSENTNNLMSNISMFISSQEKSLKNNEVSPKKNENESDESIDFLKKKCQ